MRSLFRLKICGVTRPEDATAIAAAGADAIGLNFYADSLRYVDEKTAATIIAACPPTLQKVGVFVDAPPEQIVSAATTLGLDWVQLHGAEPPESLLPLSGLAILRAFRCRAPQLQPAVDYLERCRDLGCSPQAVLLDAWHPDQYGGTGKTLDWELLRGEIKRLGEIPWVLAGGLRADNVSQAIQQLRPGAVDTASGVESAPGIKDPAEVVRFVQAVTGAFA